jgi:hypothetical protein
MLRARFTLAVLAAAALAAPAAAQAAPPAHPASCTAQAHNHFLGLGGGDSLLDLGQADCILGWQATVGAGVLRQTFNWSDIETYPGHYDFRYYDRWVAKVAAHHMRILAVLATPPAFENKVVSKYMSPPKHNADFARFAVALVQRYGPHGTFWAFNPSLPKMAIRDWQIWNEPNLAQYWGGHPNAKQYTKLLKTSYKAIKKADKRADVVTAGLPESLIHGAVRASKFIPQLYRAKARKYFDTLATNPYAPTAKGVMKAIKKTRKTMLKYHDRSGHMWMTEVGWGTGGPHSRFNIGKKGQAKQLKLLVKSMWKAHRKMKIRGLVYYGWRDRAPYPPEYKDQWGLHTGLLSASGRPKPALTILKRVAHILK